MTSSSTDPLSDLARTVCGILDIDGFMLDADHFLPREMAYVSLHSTNVASCVRFNLFPYKRALTDHDWKSVKYCQKFVHGLTFAPLPGEPVLDPRRLPSIVDEWYDRSRDEDRYVVAYKGGTIERDLLQDLNIPHANLETFGCPKYQYLPPSGLQCGFHRPSHQMHCALAEVMAFRTWFSRYLESPPIPSS